MKQLNPAWAQRTEITDYSHTIKPFLVWPVFNTVCMHILEHIL